jgi:purine-binding chemotaxis protein CheW
MPAPGPHARPHTTTIDWRTVHRCLEAAQAALEHGVTPTPEAQYSILRARAQALAHEPQREEAAREALDVVEFLLAYETYGIEASYVREVSPLKAFTPLPCTPPCVLGIINIRGQILSVIDLKTFFDLPARGLTDLNKVIVVHDEHMAFGLLADAILGVRSIPLAAIQPALPTLTGIREAYLRGVTSERGVILDAGRLLGDSNLIVLEWGEGDER